MSSKGSKKTWIPFYIEALEDGVTFSFPKNVQYRIDDGEWANLNGGETSESINTGSRIYIYSSYIGTVTINSTFTIEGKCRIGGDLMSLSYGVKGYLFTRLKEGQFYGLFRGCTSIVEVERDLLTATTLASSCYSYMFYGCTSLVNAPELPATTLASSCYSYMFHGCTSLVNAPELPATTLASSCYSYMFCRCKKLNYIKALFTTTPSSSYTNYWVYGVAFSGTFVKSKDATWNVTGENGVPEGWAVITDDQESGGGKIKNTGRIKSVSMGSTTYINWLYPVTSRVIVTVDTGMFNTDVYTSENSSTSLGITLGPGESFVSIVKVEPSEDDTYIYEVVIE